jgi:hypothetical protein
MVESPSRFASAGRLDRAVRQSSADCAQGRSAPPARQRGVSSNEEFETAFASMGGKRHRVNSELAVVRDGLDHKDPGVCAAKPPTNRTDEADVVTRIAIVLR